MNDTPHNFRPESAKELKEVSEFKDAHLIVGLYLTSRGILADAPKEKTNSATKNDNLFTDQNTLVGRTIKGPAVINGKDEQFSDLPRPIEVWEQSQKAMKSFGHNESYDFTMNGWQFSARPVRASENSCLQCHNPSYTFDQTTRKPKATEVLKIGDPLGVVLYAYKQIKD